MATGALVAGAAIKGIGSIKQNKATKAAGREQEKLDKENIELRKKELNESIRRTEIVNRETEGLARTQIGASGFGGGSSLDRYMKTIEETHKTDVDWMKTSGASQEAIAEREASARARNTRAQSKAQLWGGIGSAVTGASGAFKW